MMKLKNSKTFTEGPNIYIYIYIYIYMTNCNWRTKLKTNKIFIKRPRKKNQKNRNWSRNIKRNGTKSTF